jgi:prevent-host-death family protein
MRTAGVFEAKQQFSELIEAVVAGEEVRITRHGKQVVRMLPVPAVEKQRGSARVERGLASLRRLRKAVKPGPDWRALRDAARKI